MACTGAPYIGARVLWLFAATGQFVDGRGDQLLAVASADVRSGCDQRKFAKARCGSVCEYSICNRQR